MSGSLKKKIKRNPMDRINAKRGVRNVLSKTKGSTPAFRMKKAREFLRKVKFKFKDLE